MAKDKDVKLAYADPGVERGLPAPPRLSLASSEKVKLKKAQTYADGVTIREGEIGWTINPSSQAASWCVNFPKSGAGKPRVVPEWLLERVDAPPAAH